MRSTADAKNVSGQEKVFECCGESHYSLQNCENEIECLWSRDNDFSTLTPNKELKMPLGLQYPISRGLDLELKIKQEDHMNASAMIIFNHQAYPHLERLDGSHPLLCELCIHSSSCARTPAVCSMPAFAIQILSFLH